MTQPQDISVPSSPDLLKQTAQKLIDKGVTPTQFWINCEGLSPVEPSTEVEAS